MLPESNSNKISNNPSFTDEGLFGNDVCFPGEFPVGEIAAVSLYAR